MADTLRIPVSVAALKGVSAIAAEAAAHLAGEHHLAIGLHHQQDTGAGEPDIVKTRHDLHFLISAERLDEDVRTLREAARLVTEAFADQAIDAHPAKLSIEEVCGRLGLDVETVRAKSVTRRYA